MITSFLPKYQQILSRISALASKMRSNQKKKGHFNLYTNLDEKSKPQQKTITAWKVMRVSNPHSLKSYRFRHFISTACHRDFELVLWWILFENSVLNIPEFPGLKTMVILDNYGKVISIMMWYSHRSELCLYSNPSGHTVAYGFTYSGVPGLADGRVLRIYQAINVRGFVFLPSTFCH